MRSKKKKTKQNKTQRCFQISPSLFSTHFHNTSLLTGQTNLSICSSFFGFVFHLIIYNAKQKRIFVQKRTYFFCKKEGHNEHHEE